MYEINKKITLEMLEKEKVDPVFAKQHMKGIKKQ